MYADSVRLAILCHNGEYKASYLLKVVNTEYKVNDDDDGDDVLHLVTTHTTLGVLTIDGIALAGSPLLASN